MRSLLLWLVILAVLLPGTALAAPKLLDEPPADGACLFVYYTETGSKIRYYVPDAEDRRAIDAHLDGMATRPIGESESYEYTEYQGVGVCRGEESWEILADGVLVGYRDGALVATNPALANLALKIAREELDIVPFDPVGIRDLVEAKLGYKPYGSDEVSAQTITDEGALRTIGDILANARSYGATACPFTECRMVLTRSDGTEIRLVLASDSCDMYMVDGRFFETGRGSNGPIFELFDQVKFR